MTRKRRRHGSYAWTHPQTGYLYARVRVAQPDGTIKPIYRRATNLTHAKQLAAEIKAEYALRGQAFIDGDIGKDIAAIRKRGNILLEGLRRHDAELLDELEKIRSSGS